MKVSIIQNELVDQVRRSYKWLFRHLPKLVIYIICATQFFGNIVPLISNYLMFRTIVMVKYQIPEEITFPAFTICGCCIQKIVRDDFFATIANEEFKLLKNTSIEQVFDEQSFKWDSFVVNCSFINDTRQSNSSDDCLKFTTVLESIQDGRKCITLFSTVADDVNVQSKRMKNSERYTSYIYLELDFPNVQNQHSSDNSLQTADNIIAFHSPDLIPNMLDAEFYKLDSGGMYEIQFTKDITRLLPKPYSTKCEYYHNKRMPRSKSECINICIIRRSFQQFNCTNYHSVITRGTWNYTLNRYGHLLGDHPNFCETRGYQSYIDYVRIRLDCFKECARDCVEENYRVTIDVTEPNEAMTKSLILLWPNREMYQLVEHEGELSFVELIGCLGGHAHIWLGLSAIQFYDVSVELFLSLQRRIRLHFNNLHCS